jgi:tartrate-resistant acid phosphatase type 5
MNDHRSISRRKFLKRSFAFSAAAALAGPLGCGGDSIIPGYDENFVAPNPANVLMVGDWGFDSDITAQKIVATAMQSFLQRHTFTADALFMLGDNFYGDLTGGANSPRWQTQFEQMYPASVFNCPAYAVLGNHDYQYAPGYKCDYELAYAATGASRFTMPSPWYRFTLPAINPSLTVIALDSNMPLRPGQSTEGPSYVTMTDATRQQQLAWLQAELQKPLLTPFLAVMAHHPLYSDGSRGDNPTLIEDWDPLFRKYKVDVYLAGHDHDMQHLEFEGHPTSFFLSGGGGAPLSAITTSESTRGPFAREIFGFSYLHATSSLLTLRHLDRSGSLIHKFTKDTNGNVTIVYSAP